MRMRTAILILFSALECAAARHAKPAPRPITTDDVQNATQTDPLRPGATGARVIRAQILLDRARFSPGEIDGHFGDSLRIAIRGYQEAHLLEPTGTIDAATWAQLNTNTPPLFVICTITAEDVKGPFTPIPNDIHERARLPYLGYESAAEALGERFHISPKLLAALNPGKSLNTAGELIAVPEVSRPAPPAAVRVVVSESTHTVRAYDAGGAIIAQYPATMGGPHDPLPLGHWTIANIEHNPAFYYAPGHYWNADPSESKEKVAPGPNNPVGVVWMGLSKRHYGIHGTPDPGRIRHTESFGCIRLTNWDATDLSHMVRRGTPAILEQ
jgi:lipoprotein-anchoring transpeptidase ErfK/SrfK